MNSRKFNVGEANDKPYCSESEASATGGQCMFDIELSSDCQEEQESLPLDSAQQMSSTNIHVYIG